MCSVSFPHGAMCLSVVCDWHFLVILTFSISTANRLSFYLKVNSPPL